MKTERFTLVSPIECPNCKSKDISKLFYQEGSYKCNDCGFVGDLKKVEIKEEEKKE